MYELGRRMGKGSYGEVLRATSKRHGCECGLKILDERFADDREVNVQSGLAHPHIVRLLDSFRSDGKLYIAVEICNGGELFESAQAHGRYMEAEARVAFGQIMSAVDYLHSCAVAHRDLKLDNFLLELHGVPLEKNRLKLIDFGFARLFLPGSPTMRSKCGSEGFVAPEVLVGHGYDERCDIFSCGVLLHCLLCGKMPFKDGLRPAVGPIHFGGCDVKRKLSTESRQLVESMLQKSPTRRPFAREVLQAAWVRGDVKSSKMSPLLSPMSSAASTATERFAQVLASLQDVASPSRKRDRRPPAALRAVV